MTVPTSVRTRGSTRVDGVTESVWSRFTNDAAVCAELEAYATNQFVIPGNLPALPLPDEPHVATWAGVVERARAVGAWVALSEMLLQIRFPIASGISALPSYAAVLRRGDFTQLPAPGTGAEAVDPEGIRVEVHPTDAGAIPVITCRDRGDFETLVLACTRRNEPTPLPATMGACVVAGYNNWQRVDVAWQEARRAGTHADRAAFLAELLPQKDRYQDRFIILSSGAYSSVPAAALGLDDAEWLAQSLVLRRSHEATHYFTKRVFGSMQNALFDELLADYAGIVDAHGTFRAEWFCRFMGVHPTTGAYTGGRLANYRGQPPLSDAAFAGLARAVVVAAHALESLDRQRESVRPRPSMSRMLVGLARAGLTALVSDNPVHEMLASA